MSRAELTDRQRLLLLRAARLAIRELEAERDDAARWMHDTGGDGGWRDLQAQEAITACSDEIAQLQRAIATLADSLPRQLRPETPQPQSGS